MIFNATVHLSNDFRRTTNLAYFGGDETFDQAATAGVYDGHGFSFTVDARSHEHALEIVYSVCNSYSNGEYLCDLFYEPMVDKYRAEGNRSLSMGDMVVLTTKLPGPDAKDGRYICMGLGFKRLGVTGLED